MPVGIDFGVDKGTSIWFFMDDRGYLCLKDDQGNVNYVVLSTVAPMTGAVITPPIYQARVPAAIVFNPLMTLNPVMTLWDHLQESDF